MTAGHPVACGDDRGRPSSLSHGAPCAHGSGVDRQPTRRTGAAILAAGTASRFGATKQLAEVAGRPLVAHAVAAARDAGLAPVLVVVGHDAAAVAAAARDESRPVIVVPNPDHRAGQSTSLRAAVAVADARGLDGLVVLLADEPDISPQVVMAVAAAIGPAAPVVRARYHDGDGHPVGFHHSWFERLATVTGDRGARDLLHDAEPVRVAGDRPRDVDTPEDLPRDDLPRDGLPRDG